MSDFFRPRRSRAYVPVAAALVIFLGGTTLPTVATADTITCESHSNQTKTCRANTRGGVTLQSQLSRAECRRNSSWGYNNNFIWVSNGCRAVFRVGSDSHRSDDDSDAAAAAVAGIALLALGAAAAHEAHEKHEDDNYDDHYEYRYDDDYRDRHYRDRHRIETVSCASENRRYNYCRANVRHAHVRMVRRHSDSPCRHGQDWGYDRRGVWVENGCRATFEIEH